MDDIYLGIDYGLARIGLARSYATLAEPLLTIPNDAQVINEIKQICQKNKITALVVGVSENTMAQQSKKFGQELQTATKLPLHFADETLSSRESTARLRSTRTGKRQHQGAIDHYAAAVILQNFLDDHISASRKDAS